MSDEHTSETIQQTPPATEPAAAEARPAEQSDGAHETRPSEQQRERRPYRDGAQRGQGGQRFKKKRCRFCFNKDVKIDYKNNELLERFITDRGKILPRRITGTCSKHQRELSTAIKRARIIALVPFIVQ